jgi:hypothetical protein
MICSRPDNRIFAVVVAASWFLGPLPAASANEPPKDLLAATRAAIAATNLTPYDIGSRYGQALGASETCPGGSLTAKGAVLPSVYTDSKLAEFGVQEKKIYEAWMRVKHCVRDDSPGQCKVIIDESCATALAEIGPTGSAVPGLFEIARP